MQMDFDGFDLTNLRRQSSNEHTLLLAALVLQSNLFSFLLLVFAFQAVY